MATTVASITSRAAAILNDANVRWPTSELIDWLNDGQREVASIRPGASVTSGPITLTAGKTKHTLPVGAVELLEIKRNLGADGLTPGKVINYTKTEYLDALQPDWHAATPSTVIDQYCYDFERDPKHFYTYPPAHAVTTVQVEAVITVMPTDCVLGGNINIGDEYTNALLDYVLYRAFDKNTEMSNVTRASGYYNAFLQRLGIKKQAGKEASADKPQGAQA
jgi:hypothetical protein